MAPIHGLINIVVTVKAYPVMTSRHGEAVCVAGVTRDWNDVPHWIRLYPVPFREMPTEQQFKKWDEIEVKLTRSQEDPRPETGVPDIPSVQIVGHLDTGSAWERRRQFLADLDQRTMCQVQKAQRVDGSSLAMVRPGQVSDVTCEPRDESELEKARARIAAHRSLFGSEVRALRPIPFSFRYHYRCGTGCRGHEQTIIDWELGALFRRQEAKVGTKQAIASVREKFMNLANPATHDFALFVGNQERHPTSFVVIGVFYPKKQG